jgi:hypothetical protein
MKNCFPAYGLVAALFWLNGCISTRAVEEFTTASIAATSQLPVVATDLAESCIRQKQYQAIRANDFDPMTLQQKAETECADLRKSEKGFVAANKVLVQYLQLLDRLAGDELATYDKSLDKLAGSLTETQSLPKEQITTVNKIVKFLSGATANGWRRKQLSKAIEEANPDIQTLLATLSTIITSNYMQLLENEQFAAKSLYLTTIKENITLDEKTKEKKLKDPIAVLLLQQQWDREFKLLENRKKTVQTYGQILSTIKEGHQLLFDKRNTLSRKEVQKELLDHTAVLFPLIGDIKSTF